MNDRVGGARERPGQVFLCHARGHKDGLRPVAALCRWSEFRCSLHSSR